MGVLRESAGYTVQTVGHYGGKTTTFVVGELTRTKANVADWIMWIPGTSTSCEIAQTAGQNVILGIERILAVEPIAWTRRTLYTLYAELIRNLETLLGSISGFVTPATQPMYETLQKTFEFLVNFVSCNFDKLDDRLVTPMVKTTLTGVQKTYSVTTDFAHGKYVWVKETFVLPVTSTISSYVVMPIYKKVTGVAQCVALSAISAGALLDSHFSLVGMMQKMVNKARAVDECATKGAVTNKLLFPALEGAKSLDVKFTGGIAQELVTGVVTEFQAAKGSSTKGTVVNKGSVRPQTARGAGATSVGAPVMHAQRV